MFGNTAAGTVVSVGLGALGMDMFGVLRQWCFGRDTGFSIFGWTSSGEGFFGGFVGGWRCCFSSSGVCLQDNAKLRRFRFRIFEMAFLGIKDCHIFFFIHLTSEIRFSKKKKQCAFAKGRVCVEMDRGGTGTFRQKKPHIALPISDLLSSCMISGLEQKTHEEPGNSPGTLIS